MLHHLYINSHLPDDSHLPEITLTYQLLPGIQLITKIIAKHTGTFYVFKYVSSSNLLQGTICIT